MGARRGVFGGATSITATTNNRGGVSGSSSSSSSSSLKAASSSAGDPFVDAYRAGNAAARSARSSAAGMGGGGGGSRDEEDDYLASSSSSSSSSSFDSFDSFDDRDMQPAPLKINQDLLIYQARLLRNKALKMRKRDDRLAARLNAIRIFERAKAMDPSDGRSYVGMAHVLRSLGDHDAARLTYQDGCDATGRRTGSITQSHPTWFRTYSIMFEAE